MRMSLSEIRAAKIFTSICVNGLWVIENQVDAGLTEFTE